MENIKKKHYSFLNTYKSAIKGISYEQLLKGSKVEESMIKKIKFVFVFGDVIKHFEK